MRIDLYTKAVLTVIALCLIWMSLGGSSLLTPVSAQSSGYDRVIISGWSDENGKEHKLTYSAQFTTGLPVFTGLSR